MYLPNIVLLGFKGVGKSTVGKELAKLMYAEFVDIDNVITEVTGESIATTWQNKGEQAFDDAEHEAIRRTSLRNNLTVIATGGRAWTHERNRDILLQSGVCVWIDTDFNVIWQRVGKEMDRLHEEMNINPEKGASAWHYYAKSKEKRNSEYVKSHMKVETGNNIAPVHVAIDILQKIGILESLTDDRVYYSDFRFFPILKRYNVHGQIMLNSMRE